MTGYILSLLGIVLISVLIEIILPSGQTGKYIKSVIAIFVVYVLINPVINFLQNDFDISKYVNSEGINVDETLLKEMYEEEAEVHALDLENLLEENGYKGVKVRLIYKIVEQQIIFTKATINIDNLVISANNQNINKYDYIRQVVMSKISLKEEQVVFE